MLGQLAWQLVVLQVLDLGFTWHGIKSGQAQEGASAGARIMGAAFLIGPLVAKVAGTGLAVAATPWVRRNVAAPWWPRAGPQIALVALWAWWSGMVAVVVWNGLVLLS